MILSLKFWLWSEFDDVDVESELLILVDLTLSSSSLVLRRFGVVTVMLC